MMKKRSTTTTRSREEKGKEKEKETISNRRRGRPPRQSPPTNSCESPAKRGRPLESSTIDEEEEEPVIEEKLLEEVIKCYKEQRKQYDNWIDNDGEAAWHAASKRRRMERSVGDGTSSLRLVADESCKGTSPSHFSLRNAQNHSLHKIKSRSLPDVKCLPSMQFWARSERNIAADDEKTLSHIPFMDGQEDGFGQELLKTFEEGIHGTSRGCGEFLNDRLAHALIHQLIMEHKQLPLRTICRAVVKQFPNKLSVNQLMSVWSDLRERFEGVQDNSAVVLPNVDGDSVSVCSVERTLHSYATLFCRRCFVYDCMLHGGETSISHPRKRRRSEARSVSPCGKECFRNHSQMDARNVHWTAREETMMNVLRRSFNDDYCRVARSLAIICPVNTKRTCVQVSAYAKRSGPISPGGETMHSPTKKSKRAAKDQHRTFRAVKWTANGGAVQNEHVLVPCSHPGVCSMETGCPCVSVDNLCTKQCRCGDNCRFRFPGCRCAPGGCKTNQCQCYFASWECDPDICKSCRCDNQDEMGTTCRNVHIQRSLQKRLLLAPSEVAGWGCFSQDAIEKNEFISEYCGEVISQEESERRGKIYDRQKCSYLFGLNNEQVVDATRIGNLIRFANHSKRPNCRAKVLMVNGDHRIGIFALKPIAAGDELFFDYSYNKSQQVEFVSKERGPSTRQPRGGKNLQSTATVMGSQGTVMASQSTVMGNQGTVMASQSAGKCA